MLYPESFTDVATNHKLIKRKVLNKLNLVSKGFTLDFEISLKHDKPYSFALVKVVEPDLKEFTNIELICGTSKVKILKPEGI